jgi:tetratricopeptide (TPR) repeat protein
MRELISAQFVVEESADRFAFRHALIRQAVYGRLLLRERRELHRAIGAAIETLHADRLETHLGDLAYHTHEAQEWQSALTYSLQLGRLAEMHNNPQAAVQHFSRGLHAAREVDAPPPVALLLGRGNAYAALGAFDEALADQRAALHAALIEEDRVAQIQAHLSLGMLWAERDYETCGQHYRQAYQFALEHGDARVRAACLNRLGNWWLNLEQPEQALTLHREALLLFQDEDDEAGIAETLDLMGMAAFLSGDLIGGTASFRQAIEVFRKQDNRHGLSSSLATLSMRGATLQTNTMVVAEDPLSACIVDASRALDVAREIGWRAGEAYALWMLGFSLAGRGDYPDALEAAHASLKLAREIDHRQWMAAANCALGAIWIDLLEYERASECLASALRLALAINSRHWIRAASGLLASAHVQAGELRQALDVLAPELDPAPAKQTLAQRLLWCARVEADLAGDKPAEALLIVRGIVAASPHGESAVIPRVALLEGRALCALGVPDEARAVLQAALNVTTLREAAGLTWRLRLALAEVELAAGRREAATAHNGAALEIVEWLAARLATQAEREQFLRRAARLIPRVRPLTRLQETKTAFDGLTARQREVAGLIARGYSNRSIAETLNLSERTIESHVTAILTTLDFSSRSQIAAWAVAKGLINLNDPA